MAGAGIRDPALCLGSGVFPQPPRGGLPRRGQQLRRNHHPMAGTLGRRHRATGHDSSRNPDGRHPPHAASAVVFTGGALGRQADLRRRFGQRLEPREGVGAAIAGESASRPAAADRNRLESGRADLLVYRDQHQSSVRQHGVEVDRGLAAREAIQVGPGVSSMSPASAARRASIKSASIPTS